MVYWHNSRKGATAVTTTNLLTTSEPKQLLNLAKIWVPRTALWFWSVSYSFHINHWCNTVISIYLFYVVLHCDMKSHLQCTQSRRHLYKATNLLNVNMYKSYKTHVFFSFLLIIMNWKSYIEMTYSSRTTQWSL